MKFTSEDLMKAMGLKVGDRVKVNDKGLMATFEVTNNYGLFRLDNVEIRNARTGYELYDIFGLDFEILPKPKKVGELKCGEFKCNECPLRTIRCGKDETDIGDFSLYYILESVLLGVEFDQEIYDLLKARLDKEVK